MDEQDAGNDAAGIEHYSEHPLASAVLSAAKAEGISIAVPDRFDLIVGKGVVAQLNGEEFALGNMRLLEDWNVQPSPDLAAQLARLESEGKTTLLLANRQHLLGVLAAAAQSLPDLLILGNTSRLLRTR